MNKTLFFLIFLIFKTLPVQSVNYDWEPVHHTFDSITYLLEQQNYEKDFDDTSIGYALQLERIATQTQIPILEARSLYWNVCINQITMNPDLCIIQLNKSLSLIDTLKYKYDYARVSYQLAGNYHRVGKYFDSYQTLNNNVMSIFQQASDFLYLGNYHYLMALIFNEVYDKDAAIQQCLLSKENYQKAQYPLSNAYFLEGLLKTDKTEEAISLFRQAITEDLNNLPIVAQSYNNIAEIYIKCNELDSASLYINKGLDYINKQAPDNKILRGALLINKIAILYNKKDYAQALTNLKEMDVIIKEYNKELFVPTCYKYYYLVYSKMGEVNNAFHYLSLYQAEYEQRVVEANSIDLHKQKARENINRQTDYINLLQKESELRKRYIYIIILVFTVIALTIISITILFYMRVHIKKIENRELQNSLENEKLIADINKTNLEKDIEQKKREMSSTALLLVQKNEVLQQIKEITEKYTDTKPLPTDYVKTVNHVITQSLENDDEWERFRIHFDLVHPNFFSKLKDISQNLTENDLRLCAYIRIGMRAKEIAAMISVHPDSINSNRYRLRKKLNLEKNDSLDDFLREL